MAAAAAATNKTALQATTVETLDADATRTKAVYANLGTARVEIRLGSEALWTYEIEPGARLTIEGDDAELVHTAYCESAPVKLRVTEVTAA